MLDRRSERKWVCVCIRPERTKRNVRAAAAAPEEAPHACARFGRVESRRPAEKGASKAPSTTLVRQGARGFLHEIRCTRRNSGTLRVRPVPNPVSYTHLTLPTNREGREEEDGGEWCQQTLRQACSQEYPGSARCVQSFDDSLDSASRKTYRISLRSSSLWEPRHPSLKVLQR